MALIDYLDHRLTSKGVQPLARLVAAAQEISTPRHHAWCEALSPPLALLPSICAALRHHCHLVRCSSESVQLKWELVEEEVFEPLKARWSARRCCSTPTSPRTLIFVLRFIRSCWTRHSSRNTKEGQGRSRMPARSTPTPWLSTARRSWSVYRSAGQPSVSSLPIRPAFRGDDGSQCTSLTSDYQRSLDRLHGWATVREDFGLEVRYHPGCEIVVADALSGSPIAGCA